MLNKRLFGCFVKILRGFYEINNLYASMLCCGTAVDVGGQFQGVSSFLPLYGIWRSDLGC